MCGRVPTRLPELTYRDLSESAMEQANHLRHLERGERTYTRERLEELAPLMGVTVLQTKKRVAMLDALNTTLEMVPTLGQPT